MLRDAANNGAVEPEMTETSTALATYSNALPRPPQPPQPPQPPSPQERTSGGKGGVHGSDSWELALAQDLRQRIEVAAVAAVAALPLSPPPPPAPPPAEGAAAAVTTGEYVTGVAEATVAATAMVAATATVVTAGGRENILQVTRDPFSAGMGESFDQEVVVKTPEAGGEYNLAGEEQGSDAWHALRATRLTASAFGNALGFWFGRRNELWWGQARAHVHLIPIFHRPAESSVLRW